MKNKVITLTSTTIMLVSVLMGCGAAQNDPDVETFLETTITEPTIETTMETEPIEPKTVFDAQGLALWEEPFVPESFLGMISGSDSRNAVEATSSSADKIGMVFYSMDNQWAKNIISSEIVDSDIEIDIMELQPEHFDAFEDVVQQFYEADVSDRDIQISKEEWLSLYDDWKIIYLDYDQIGRTVGSIKNAIDNQAEFWGATIYLPEVVDMKLGDAISPSSSNSGKVGMFTIHNENAEFDMMIQCDYSAYWINDSDPYYTDLQLHAEYYVMVPDSYDYIAFCLTERLSPRTEEEIIEGEEETEGPWVVWNVCNGDEEEKSGKIRRYYFAHIPNNSPLLTVT